MITNHSLLIHAGLAAAILTPAFALEAPVDDAPPPPQVAGSNAALPQFKLPPDQPAEAPEKRVGVSETAFLGVVSAGVPEVLADHLNLKPDEGIVVRSMAPDSPAMRSGIAINDVVLTVDGQPVGSQAELSSRITARKPGDEVNLEIIHKGKPAKILVTLGTRPSDLAMESSPSLDPMALDNLPKEMADQIRDAIGGMDLKLGGANDAMPPQMEEAIRELQKRMQGEGSLLGDMLNPPAPAAEAGGQNSASLIMKDGDGSIEVKSKDGSKEVTVRDQQDTVVWSGPWNTEAERAAAPDNVRRRMEALHLDDKEAGGALKFNFNRKADPANPDN